MDISIPPGVFDILPEDPQDLWKSSYLWNYVESIMRKTALAYGFAELRTPMFEKTELFTRGVGETSDIVTKEMYTFIDKGERSLTLRPEGTAPVMRAFIDNHLHQKAPIHKLFYICPMFRYERAQAGRFRQHHQFGIEVIGIEAPEQDAEVIALAYEIYQKLGLKNLSVSLNSIGDSESRAKYHHALKEYLKKHFSELSEDSKIRFEKNPLRILDSKNQRDRLILENAPSILDFLNEESKKHFDIVKYCLSQLKIPFQENPKLVRGLDYYNKTVFEITSENLGAQNSLCGGGRYDGLLASLGGPDLPSTGFATGIERVLQTMIAQKVPLPSKFKPHVFFIPMGDKAKETCFVLTQAMRQQGISVQMDLSGRKLNKSMNYANQIGAMYVAVVGDKELESGEVDLKEMSSGLTTKVPLKQLSAIFQMDKLTEDFIGIWDKMTTPFEDPALEKFFINRLSKGVETTTSLSNKLKDAFQKMQVLLEDKS